MRVLKFIILLAFALAVDLVIVAGVSAADSQQGAEGNPRVTSLMSDALDAFQRRDYRTALAKYTKAVELEPGRYDSTLFVGNSYFALEKWDDAIVWYARATEINPNIEIGFRWWGDALMWQKKYLQARDKYIEAIVAEPYNQKPQMSIRRWIEYARANNVRFQIRNPQITVPMSVKDRAVLVSPGYGKGPNKGQEAWFAYGMSLALDKDGHVFEREVKAMRAVVSVAREQGYTKDTPLLDPSLATLLRLEEKGLLEAYILFARATREIAQHYPAYRDKHRATLRRYWAEEVIQLQ